MRRFHFCLLPLAFCLLPFVAAAADRTVVVLQFPPDQKVGLSFYRTGAVEKIDGTAEVRRSFKKSNSTKVEVSIKDAPAPSSVKPEYQAYVAWAVDAKGGFTRLGAISKDLKVETPLKAFGIVISLEANPEAAAPTGLFVLESEFPDKKNSFFGMTKVVYTRN